jgi:hypothetical protein
MNRENINNSQEYFMEINAFQIPFCLIQMDISGHPPFPTGSKQFSDIFGNLLFLAVFTSGAILRA